MLPLYRGGGGIAGCEPPQSPPSKSSNIKGLQDRLVAGRFESHGSLGTLALYFLQLDGPTHSRRSLSVAARLCWTVLAISVTRRTLCGVWTCFKANRPSFARIGS
jgi:hypothetical protein